MASLVFPKAQKKGPSIQWYSGDGERLTLYLGKCPKRWAEEFARRLESLIEHRRFRQALDHKTATWLRELGPKWRAKLVSKGLLDGHAIASLADLVDHCRCRLVESNGSEASLSKLDIAAANLTSYFDAARSLESITPADAADYAVWLRRNGRRDGRGSELSSTTAGKQLSVLMMG